VLAQPPEDPPKRKKGGRGSNMRGLALVSSESSGDGGDNEDGADNGSMVEGDGEGDGEITMNVGGRGQGKRKVKDNKRLAGYVQKSDRVRQSLVLDWIDCQAIQLSHPLGSDRSDSAAWVLIMVLWSIFMCSWCEYICVTATSSIYCYLKACLKEL